jgi:Tfp pilus assembly PilM family ATPase
MDREKDPRVFDAIIPVITDLKEQIKQYIDFYTGHATHIHNNKSGIWKVLLSGGDAQLIGLEKYLTLALGIPVEKVNPWINILEPPLRETPELSYEDSIRYATALGLALTGY